MSRTYALNQTTPTRIRRSTILLGSRVHNAGGDTLRLEGSLPTDGSADVPLDTWLALRFSRPLRVTTVNQATVTLSEGDRPVAAKVVSAEGGRLAFVAPEMPLLPGAAYVLRLDNLSD